MSTPFHTWTFIARPADIATAAQSQAGLAALRPLELPGTLSHVYGSSRNDWAGAALRSLVPQFGGDALSFLLGSRAQHRRALPEMGVVELWTVLDRAACADALGALPAFFGWCRANVEAVAAVSGSYTYEEIRALTLRDTVSKHPQIDGEAQRDEEGDDLDYLFTWLRSVGRVIEGAQARELAVVHQCTDFEFKPGAPPADQLA